MFKPAFPYLKDVIAHALFLQQHMATVHFENGKYHVHAEVTENAKEENKNKNIPSSKKENSSSDHILSTIKTNALSPLLIVQKFLQPVDNNLCAGNVKYNYPPPRI